MHSIVCGFKELLSRDLSKGREQKLSPLEQKQLWQHPVTSAKPPELALSGSQQLVNAFNPNPAVVMNSLLCT